MVMYCRRAVKIVVYHKINPQHPEDTVRFNPMFPKAPNIF